MTSKKRRETGKKGRVTGKYLNDLRLFGPKGPGLALKTKITVTNQKIRVTLRGTLRGTLRVTLLGRETPRKGIALLQPVVCEPLKPAGTTDSTAEHRHCQHETNTNHGFAKRVPKAQPVMHRSSTKREARHRTYGFQKDLHLERIANQSEK